MVDKVANVNDVVRLIQSHRSIRKYTEQAIPLEILDQILKSAQWAPSSHNVQAYSIIVVKSMAKKEKLAKICGSQKWVATCPVFLVFCADFYRLKLTTDMHHTSFEINEVENLLVGAVDVALAAENALLTARSYGLGGVLIGGIRNQLADVAKLLEVPELVIPIVGMCLGYPADEPWQKPRLPQRAVVHEEVYHKDELPARLDEYDAVSADYYTRRTSGQKTSGWTRQMAEYLSKPRRPHLKEFILKQGIKLT
ncbi:MAG: oxygen-insensitive NADPH nitroreductase [Desulfitobacteriaceae bacterium]